MEETFELVGYQLVRETPIREKPLPGETYGDILDWSADIIAESKTINGLKRFARLKKIDLRGECSYYIESVEKRRLSSYPGKYFPSSGELFRQDLTE
jgi:hypothetical protein